MVFEHLWDFFHLKDSTTEFSQLFQFFSHITKGHIPRRIAHILETIHVLTMTKPLGGIHPISLGETLYQLTRRANRFFDKYHIKLHTQV
jgi:hypothetical protein